MLDRKRAKETYFVTLKFAALLTPPRVAVKVTVWVCVTALWLTLNVALVFPDGITTVPGPLATPELELAKLTDTPPVGAAPLIVTVPVTTVVELPFTDRGARVRPMRLDA